MHNFKPPLTLLPETGRQHPGCENSPSSLDRLGTSRILPGQAGFGQRVLQRRQSARSLLISLKIPDSREDVSRFGSKNA